MPAKHRVTLSDDEVKYLSRILKWAYTKHLSSPPYNPEIPHDPVRGFDQVTGDYCLQVMGKISNLETKINLGVAKPAYTVKQSLSLEQSLGMEPVPPAETPEEKVAAFLGTQSGATQEYASKEAYWEACHQKLEEHGLAALNAEEIAAAQEHRYLNDLMNPEELAAFEKQMLDNISKGDT